MTYSDEDARFDAEQLGRCPLCGRERCKHCKECGKLNCKKDHDEEGGTL